MNLTPKLTSVATAALFSLPLGAAAQSVEPFAKTITILVAGTAGGGVDLYGRWVGRHIGRHIPGNPSVIVQVMPGAGGIRAANYLAEKAARDGSVLGTFPGGPLLEPLIGTRNPNYNMSEFNWIGAVSRDVSVCVAWGAGPFKSINDVKTREMVVAGTGAGSETDTFPVMLNSLLETKFKVVTGYVGSKETFMATEREEVHGRCGRNYSSLNASKPDLDPRQENQHPSANGSGEERRAARNAVPVGSPEQARRQATCRNAARFDRYRTASCGAAGHAGRPR